MIRYWQSLIVPDTSVTDPYKAVHAAPSTLAPRAPYRGHAGLRQPPPSPDCGSMDGITACRMFLRRRCDRTRSGAGPVVNTMDATSHLSMLPPVPSAPSRVPLNAVVVVPLGAAGVAVAEDSMAAAAASLA